MQGRPQLRLLLSMARQPRKRLSRPRRAKPIAAGISAGFLLFSAYFALLTALNSPAHAIQQFLAYGWLMGPLIAGFGAQVGLLVHLRSLQRCGAASTAASGGVSSATMAACCAHHATDVAAVLGISALTAALASWQVPLLVLGLVSNGLGLLHLLRKLVRSGPQAHAPEDPAAIGRRAAHGAAAVIAHPLSFRLAAAAGGLAIAASILVR